MTNMAKCILIPIKALAITTVPCLDVLKISVGIDVGSSAPRPVGVLAAQTAAVQHQICFHQTRQAKKYLLIVSCSTMNSSLQSGTTLCMKPQFTLKRLCHACKCCLRCLGSSM